MNGGPAAAPADPPAPVMVYALFADADEADRIGTAMVEGGLAACVNILAPCRSIYRWQGRIEKANETPALFKTGPDHAEALIAAIAQAHSYDVPAIMRWDTASAHPPYAAWVAGMLRP